MTRDRTIPDMATLPQPPPGRYEQIGGWIGRLVDKKQRAYGRSFDRAGKIIQILYPAGISPGQYDDVLAIVRILDKFFRIATHSGKDTLGEDPWIDVAGCALLMNRKLLEKQAEELSSEQESHTSHPAGSTHTWPDIHTRSGGEDV